VFTSINSLAHKLGQGVLQDGLQTLIFGLGDMHRPSPNMEEDMEFQKGLSVKKILEFTFLWICMMVEQLTRLKWCFGIKVKIDFIILPNFLD
jgi:hypothetical protein